MNERSVWASRILVVVLGIAAAIAGIFVFVRDRDSGSGELHIRNSYLVMTEDGKLEVRDGATGNLLRLLRDDLVIGEVGHRIEVTESGRFAFHDGAIVTCDGVEFQAIERVDLVRGVNQLFAVGSKPSLESEERRLQFNVLGEGTKPVARVTRGRWECEDDATGNDVMVGVLDLETNDVTYEEGEDRRMPTDVPDELGDDVVAAARLN